MVERQAELKLSRPTQYTLLYALFIFLVASLFLEWAARQPFVQEQVPYQAFGTNHTQMEIQLDYLDRFVEDHGAPDCFIFGSSQAFRGVDADALTIALNSGTGDDFSCYNFGVTGSQVATTSVLAKILMEEYHPRLIIIGTSFLDYTEGRERQLDERFINSEWLKYKTGRFSINGWLMEHSYAWRFITLLSYSTAYDMNFREVLREAHKWDGEIAESGYAISNISVNPNYPAGDGFVKNFRQELGSYGLSNRNMLALEQLVHDSKTIGARVLIVEMPYHKALLNLYDPSRQPRVDQEKMLTLQRTANERISAIASAQDASFLMIDSSLTIPNNVWFDLYHLNRSGAELFSQWIGEHAAGFLTQ